MRGKSIVNKHMFMARHGSKEVLDQIMNDEYKIDGVRPPSMARAHVFMNQNHTEEHITRGLRDEDGDVAYSAIMSEKATPEHITTAMDHTDDHVRMAAISNPNINAHHVMLGLTDPSKDIFSRTVYKARIHQLLKPEHIDDMLNSPDPVVRVRVFGNQTGFASGSGKSFSNMIKKEHLEKGINDESEMVSNAARRYVNERNIPITTDAEGKKRLVI